MEIVEKLGDVYKIRIEHKQDENIQGYAQSNIGINHKKAYVEFSPKSKELSFLEDNTLTDYLKENEYQFRKLLHNKRPRSYYVGFKLIFSFRDKKDVAGFNDRKKIVVLDKSGYEVDSYVMDKGDDRIHKIYTDGSFLEKQNKGAFALIIEDLEGNYKTHSEKVFESGSSQTELMAAMKGLEILKDVEKIRIVTDSQYVRKGLTEWIFCWKINGWLTANGEKVKDIDNWVKFDKLTEGKYIEFQWVKGHSDHFENTLCDLYAKEATK
ncbi:ribonuclease H family protein [Oceanirhabdus sp. W0125-5]|uniref:ribonuclease H family protein n=1 Tax=Oceanirhabdus sp. W0125-5 TaxID=2999116 RepID=UPI0022F3065B|nr:ribonuclease H [Oceanirhabdus sp. W0125-5]WBW94997.1 ribonuclease HI [Oceanirhabdus sp. W0125-5]